MPRKPKEHKKPPGKPPAPIDWGIVDKLLQSDCSGVQIAGRLGISPQTLYARCEIDNGVVFSAYSAEKKADGDSLLKETQFFEATIAKNTALLIFLGKTRLGQKENNDAIKDLVIHELRAGLKQLSKESGGQVAGQPILEAQPSLQDSGQGGELDHPQDEPSSGSNISRSAQS